MTLYLIDGDEPRNFPPAKVTVTRAGLNVGERQAVAISISPPILGLASGPLSEAVLVSRRQTEIGAFLAGDPSRGLGVYVCRYPAGSPTTAPDHLDREDLRIELWGLLSDSPSSDIREH